MTAVTTEVPTKAPTEAPTLHSDAPLWAWAQDAISHRLDEMFQHTEGVRLGEDIEAVHDMRVGSRRLVAAMKVFAASFPGPEYQDLLREARRVTRRLGAVRDLDVLIDHYERLRENAKPEEQVGIEYFLAIHDRLRNRARKPMLAALEEMEKDHLGGRIRRYLEEESQAYRFGLHSPVGHRQVVDPMGPFRHAAPPILEDRYRTYYSFEQYVDDPEEVEQLHEMRIAAKWLRYTMELFAPAYQDVLKSQISAVKKIQELLGDLHDSDVRLDILRALAAGTPDLRGLEALGVLLPDPVIASVRVLLAREEEARRGYYQAFHKEWRKQARKDFARTLLERIHRPDAA